MGKWVLPHEMDAVSDELKTELNPRTATPKFILPHEVVDKKEPDPYDETLAKENDLQKALIGAGARLNDVGLGIKQRVGQAGNAIGVKNDWPEQVAEKAKSLAPAKAAISRNPYSRAGNIGAEMALGMLSPSARLLPAMMTGAAMNTLGSPDEVPSGGNLLTDAAEGALFSGAGTMLLNGPLTALAKGKNAYKGRFSDSDAERRFMLGKREEVPLSWGDITQNPTIMGFENMAQHIPFAKGPRNEFLQTQGSRMRDIIDQAPANIAGSVASETKEDIGQTLAKSIREKYKANKNEATRLYDDVANRVSALKAPPVPPNELRQTAQQLLQDYPDAFEGLMDKKALSILEDIVQGTGPRNSKVLGPNGQPIQVPAQLSFDEVRWLDKRLGSITRQARQRWLAGNMDAEAFSALTQLQPALRNDVSAWSQAIGSPDIATGVAKANAFWRENVKPFRDNPTTKNVLFKDNVNTDSLPAALFKLDAPTKTSQALNFLTPEGIQAGRYYLLRKAEQDAIDEARGHGYSAFGFLKSTKLGETGPKLYSPDELQKLKDLQELTDITRRSSGYAPVDPPTGNRLLGLTPAMSLKIPFLAKLFTESSQSETPIKYLLSHPRWYTGDEAPSALSALTGKTPMSDQFTGGALQQTAENLMRKLGVGPYQPDE